MVELDNYVTNQGLSCQLSCIRDIFGYHGIEIDESDLYCFGNGFRYIYESKLKIHSGIPITIKNFFNEFGIHYIEEKNIKSEIAEEILIESIKSKNPIMIAVSNSELNYDAEFKQHGSEMGHVITVIGIDEDANRIKVSDGFIPASPPRKFQGWCNYDLIKPAREKWGNWYLSIDLNSINKFKENYFNGFTKGLEKSLLKSLNELVKGQICNGSYYGLEALKKYHIELKNFERHFSTNFSYQLYQQNIILKMEGFIDNKQYLCQTIKKLSVIRQKDELIDIYAQLDGNLKKWTNFCLMIVKFSISNSMEKVNVLADKFEELYMEEVKICNLIISCLNN